MRNRLCLLSLLCLALTDAARADDTGARRIIENAYAKFSRACLKQDLKAVMETFTPDVVFKTPDGKSQTYPDVKRAMRGFINGLGPGSQLAFDVKIVDRKSDSRIVALVEEKLHQVAPKRAGVVESDSPTAITVTARWRDTWVKTKRGWQNSIGVTLPDK